MKKKSDDTQINMILKVRAMRVDGLRRLRAMHEAQVNRKSQEIFEHEEALQNAREARVADERRSLEAMVQVDTVKLDSIVSFIKLQQRGVRQLNEIRRDIESAKDGHEHALDVFRDSERKTQKAEKRLIAIEEVVKEQLWK